MALSEHGLQKLRESGKRVTAKRWTKTIAERFNDKISHTPSCWLWIAAIDSKGYGRFDMTGRWRAAHRVAWEFTHGPIPTGMSVCHTCDTRACVRVDHLFLGTNADNVADKMAKHRHRNARGEAHPRHKITPAIAAEIRSAYASGERQAHIARRFGLSDTHVNRVVNHHSWC